MVVKASASSDFQATIAIGSGALVNADLPTTSGRKSGPERGSDILSDTLLGDLLSERGSVQSSLFDDFINHNPSFSPNTTRAYLTQVSQFLLDWLEHYAEFPQRFLPFVRGLEILHDYREADRGLTVKERAPLAVAQLKKKLEKEHRKDWKEATLPKSLRSETRSRSMRPRFRESKQPLHLPDTGLARGDQAMLGWLLSEYEPILDSNFWAGALSNRAIGTLTRDYLENGASAATVCLRMTAINHFRVFLSQKYGFPVEAVLKQPAREETQEVVHEVQDLEELASYLATEAKIEGDYRSLRNEALFLLCYTTGARASELCALKMSDLNLDRSSVTIAQKNKKKRIFPLASKVLPKFDAYLKSRGKFLEDKSSTSADALFLSTRGSELSRFRLYDAFVSMGESAGLTLPLGPHSIRRSAACALHDRGVPLHVIQQFLGHSKLKTTLLYLSHGAREAFNVALDFHPLSSTTSKSLRAKALRQSGRLKRPLRLDVSNRTDRDPKKFKIRSARDDRNDNPGYLKEHVSLWIPEGKTLLERFTTQRTNLSQSSKKQYQKAVRHFLIERFHSLALERTYEPALRKILQYYLLDRLDWHVRTGEIGLEASRQLYADIQNISEDEAVFLRGEVIPTRNRESRVLLSGIDLSVQGDTVSLELPYLLHLEKSSKEFGIREKLIGMRLLGEIEKYVDADFWSEIFRPELVGRVFEGQRERGNGEKTIHKQASALRVFAEFVDSFYETSPQIRELLEVTVSSRKSSSRPQLVLTIGEMQRLFDAMRAAAKVGTKEDKLLALHDHALLSVFYTTAARSTAVSKLKLRDISWHREIPTIYLREKGDREVLMPILPATQKVLRNYLRARGALNASGSIRSTMLDEPLFLPRKSGVIDNKKMQRMLTDIAERAELDITMQGTYNLSPHDIRRSALIHMGQNGASPAEIMGVAGHKDLEVTAQYLSYGQIEHLQLVTEYLPKLG